jgi:hypothetical protein
MQSVPPRDFGVRTACRRFVTALLSREYYCDKATAGRRTPKLRLGCAVQFVDYLGEHHSQSVFLSNVR